MAQMTYPSADSLPTDGWIVDPCVGSGGMFRAAVQRIRDLGLNPHDCNWFGIDIDPIAAACTAVNAIVWDLGPKVVIAQGNSLTSDWGLESALRERQSIIEHRNQVVGQANMIAAIRRAERLLRLHLAA
ncbi:N-6 DNA methylase [Streptomyces luteireticuli]|uniref:N-6 DNA methylase n=1 Tax=Streptomyces luteireticuli TaxID=173858 RepID=UPI0035565145